MSDHTVTVPVSTQADLSRLLRAAASGDVDAFRRFTEATLAYAYRLELARALARGASGAQARTAAEHATRHRYAEAWRRVREQPTSGLSPRAWLLALPLVRAAAA